MADISAKVAAVVSPTQLAFNAGSEHGVQKNQNVMLYRVVTVMDPDTKQDLGSVRVPKLRLRVNHVEEKFCVATVLDTFGSDPSQPQVLVGSLISHTKTVTLKESPLGDSANSVLVKIGEEALIFSR